MNLKKYHGLIPVRECVFMGQYWVVQVAKIAKHEFVEVKSHSNRKILSIQCQSL